MDGAYLVRERAVLARIRRELMDRHADGLGCAGGEPDGRSLDGDASGDQRFKMRKLSADEFANIDALAALQQEILARREARKTRGQLLRKRLRVATAGRLTDNGHHHGHEVLRSVIDLLDQKLISCFSRLLIRHVSPDAANSRYLARFVQQRERRFSNPADPLI
jgi:hypothetical protein